MNGKERIFVIQSENFRVITSKQKEGLISGEKKQKTKNKKQKEKHKEK